jgi:hypothetical protein
MKLLSFDPAGNWGKKEGMGTTGYAVFVDGELEEFGSIKASDYPCIEAYWLAHENLILREWPDILLVESYKLFESKAQSQSWSTLDTPRLIGTMMMVAYKFNIHLVFQDPQQKQGVTDERLVKLGYFEKKGNRYYINGKPTIIHERDSIRHGIYYFRYGKGKQDATVLHQSGRE